MSAEALFDGFDPPKPPPTQKVSERIMLDALMQRYDKTVRNGGWAGKRFLRAEHVPIGLSWKRHRIADFIAMDTQSHRRGDWRAGDEQHQLAPVFHGHEVKVSRSDWLTELRDPSKSEVFKRHMHFWWLVVPDKTIVRDDLPEGWGLIAGVKGSLRIVKQAPLLTPEPMPNSLVGALLRATTRTEATPIDERTTP